MRPPGLGRRGIGPSSARQAATHRLVSGATARTVHDMRNPSVYLGWSGWHQARWNYHARPHLLISGPTGSGKSSAVLRLLSELRPTLAAPVWRIVVIDGKGGLDFEHLRGLVPLHGPGVAGDAMTALAMEMRTRVDKLRAVGATDVTQWHGPDPMPRTLIICDELADLLGGWDMSKEDAARFRASFGAILRMGRATGMHIVASILRPDASLFGGGLLRDQFGARILLGDASVEAARMLDLPPGNGRTGHGTTSGLTHGPGIVIARTTRSEARAGVERAVNPCL